VAPVVELFSNPTLLDLVQVLAQLPESERAQYRAKNGVDLHVDIAASQLYLQPGPKWVVADGLTPICVGGFTPVSPGVWRDWMANTPAAFGKYWRQVSKFARRTMDAMLVEEAHRLECVVLASRTEVVDWYGFLGYSFEGTMRHAGAQGEDFALYSRVRNL
jgi:hypothetical protein